MIDAIASLPSEAATTATTSLAGILGATATILITTLDDCVWLVPYLAPTSVRIQHAAIFAITLIGLTSVTVATTYLFRIKFSSLSVIGNEETLNTVIQAFGAVLCWILAGYYSYRSWQKRQRRQLQRKQQKQHQNVYEPNTESNYGSCNTDESSAASVDPLTTTTKTISTPTISRSEDISINEYNSGRSSYQPLTIVTLTISGALDEISYFPSLVLGHIFTGTELIIGTLITVLIMLCIVTQFLQHCQPLLHCLDRIPLYGVISLYAIILTINLIIDLI